LTAVGHRVRLIPPQYVKPFVKRSKTDSADAEAICEALPTLEMVRVCCPDGNQASLISESFGLPVLDSDGIRDLHDRMFVETADALGDGLGERAMQIHLQRIVGAYVGSAHGAGQTRNYLRNVGRFATWRPPNTAL